MMLIILVIKPSTCSRTRFRNSNLMIARFTKGEQLFSNELASDYHNVLIF